MKMNEGLSFTGGRRPRGPTRANTRKAHIEDIRTRMTRTGRFRVGTPKRLLMRGADRRRRVGARRRRLGRRTRAVHLFVDQIVVRVQTPELFSRLTLQDSASTTRFRVKIATLSKVCA